MIISVPATSANLGPGFDSLGLALDLRLHISTPDSERMHWGVCHARQTDTRGGGNSGAGTGTTGRRGPEALVAFGR